MIVLDRENSAGVKGITNPHEKMLKNTEFKSLEGKKSEKRSEKKKRTKNGNKEGKNCEQTLCNRHVGLCRIFDRL